jgi:chromate transporter
MLLFSLFIEYFKIGLFAIGGGMATIPFLSKLAERTHWFTQNDLLNMIAVSESTPGPIGVNTATYVGFHINGITGMLVATIGLITPSIIVIICVYSALKKFGDNFYVKSGMYGLRAASCGLIGAAGLLVAKVTLLDSNIWNSTHDFMESLIFSRILLAAVLLVLTTKFKKVHPVAWLAIAGIVGVLFHFGS